MVLRVWGAFAADSADCRFTSRTTQDLGPLWAQASLLQNRLRFPLMPKIHYLHHGFRDMLVLSRQHPWVPNMLHSSVQLDEDMVGRVARLSRRVGSHLLMRRTLQRYLILRSSREQSVRRHSESKSTSR